MSVGYIAQVFRDMLFHTTIVSAPILIVSMIVGLIIGIIQTTTSIQEQTLSFVPKIIAIFAALAFFWSFIMTDLINYTVKLFMDIPQMVR